MGASAELGSSEYLVCVAGGVDAVLDCCGCAAVEAGCGTGAGAEACPVA